MTTIKPLNWAISGPDGDGEIECGYRASPSITVSLGEESRA